MYLFCGTRSDIFFVIGQLSKQNTDPWMGDFKATKQVVQYLKGTMHLKLTHGAHSQSEKEAKASASSPLFGLIEYVDSNYASDPEDKKLVMSYCFFIHEVLVS